MKTNFLFIFFFLFLVIKAYSQIEFEKGYFINLENERIECLIKNKDWKNNPIEFEYKLSETGNYKKEGVTTVKEFGIDNISKYIGREVQIDRSSENIQALSSTREPEW